MVHIYVPSVAQALFPDYRKEGGKPSNSATAMKCRVCEVSNYSLQDEPSWSRSHFSKFKHCQEVSSGRTKNVARCSFFLPT